MRSVTKVTPITQACCHGNGRLSHLSTRMARWLSTSVNPLASRGLTVRKSHARPATVLASLAVIVVLCAPARPAFALLVAKDGADQATQAAVQAYNNALLLGPSSGQTAEAWAQDLQEKHDAVFGHTCDFNDVESCFTYTVGTDKTGATLGPPVDLCNGAITTWMTDPLLTGDTSQAVAQAIHDPSIHAALNKNLAYYLWGMFVIKTDPSDMEFNFPTYPSPWSLSCNELKGFPGQFQSSMPGMRFPVKVHMAIGPIDVAHATGTVTFEASWSSRHILTPTESEPNDYWCATLNMDTYQTAGFGILEPPVRSMINATLGDGLLCNYGWDQH